MRTNRVLAATALVAALGITATACGGSSNNSSGKSGGSDKGVTLTYWASNQGTSLDNDKQVLTPELKKFQQQTGIKVKLEVVGWADLLNRILAATTSGQGPDVLNIGNTWSASLQATGALLPFDSANFTAIGGKDRFAASAIAAAGAAGKDPAAVPLYSMAYGLYYNKKMFADAGLAAADDLGRAGHRRQEAHHRRPLRHRGRGQQRLGEHPPRLRARPSSAAPTGSTRPASRPSPPTRTSRPSSSTSTSSPTARPPRATPSTRRTRPSPTSPPARPR